MGTAMIVSREDARARGLKRFFTGLPCDVGHIAERYVSGAQCCECNNAAFREYRAANRDRELARRHKDYQRNRDKELAYYRDNKGSIRPRQIARYKENAVAIRAAQRAKRRANIEASLQKERIYREKNPQAVRARRAAWVKANPDYTRVKRHRRRAREQGAPGEHTADDIKKLHQAQKGRCAICFERLRGRYTVDHILALSRGGTNDVANLQLACRPCNAKKWAKDPIKFARELGRLL